MSLANSAEALRVTHVFEGEVTVLAGDYVPAEFADALGKRFRYTLSYDTGISGHIRFLPQGPADQDPFEASYRARFQAIEPPDPNIRLFEFVEPRTTFEFVLGGDTIDTSAPLPETFTLEEQREVYRPFVKVSNNSTFLGGGFGVPIPDGFNFGPIDLVDSSGTAFSDISLPLSLELANFDIAELRVVQTIGVAFLMDLRGPIDSISTTVVPEPGTALLVGLGLGWLGLRGRRNRPHS